MKKLCISAMFLLLASQLYGAEVATKWVQVGKGKISEKQSKRELSGISERHFESLRLLFGSMARQAARKSADQGIVHINLENPKDPIRDYKSVRVYQDGNQACIRFFKNQSLVSSFNIKDYCLFQPGYFDLDYPDKLSTPVVCDKNGNVHIYLQNAQQQVVRYTLREVNAHAQEGKK